jgi:hypothetical protein
VIDPVVHKFLKGFWIQEAKKSRKGRRQKEEGRNHLSFAGLMVVTKTQKKEAIFVIHLMNIRASTRGMGESFSGPPT